MGNGADFAPRRVRSAADRVGQPIGAGGPEAQPSGPLPHSNASFAREVQSKDRRPRIGVWGGERPTPKVRCRGSVAAATRGGGPVWAPPATRSPGPVAQSVKVPLSAARMCPEFLLIRDQRAGPGEVRIQMAAGLPPTIRHASDWLVMRCYRAQPYSNFYSFSSERFSPPPSFLSSARRLAFSFRIAFDSGAQ